MNYYYNMIILFKNTIISGINETYNPPLEVRRPFALTCNVNTTLGSTAKSVYFLLDDELIDQQYVDVVDDRTAVLRHPGMRLKYDQKWICCYLKNVERDLGCWIMDLGCELVLFDIKSMMVDLFFLQYIFPSSRNEPLDRRFKVSGS